MTLQSPTAGMPKEWNAPEIITVHKNAPSYAINKSAFPLNHPIFAVSAFSFHHFGQKSPKCGSLQVEGQFAIASITSDTTNFNHVIKHLDPQYSKENLAGSCVCEDFLRTIWSSLLPSHIQTLLASQPHSPLEALADVADRVQDSITRTTNFINILMVNYKNMTSEIAELKHAVKNLTAHLNRPYRSPTRTVPERNEADPQPARALTTENIHCVGIIISSVQKQNAAKNLVPMGRRKTNKG
ncbi:hypothetical protein EVAR_34741_1 [Eumeta japonica]|uniref:Uncharacterized protein n=1 Tax=Eumeta variegata TaxID=151549 RepID=A0A4C1XGC7_EUMVA|nr:hypothetical protein EVAR_34741_1 [Eumeta japonica]